ncbi:MAG: spore coat protein [Actinomycetota bacterium]|nr:spore coat protein [Actinomycetota bacterium]
MSSTLVAFCDVGPASGVGHLMRCIALAEEYAARGFRVVFAADAAAVPFARGQLAARGFECVPPPVSTDGYAEFAARLDAKVVLVDSYHLPREVYAALQSAHPTIALVDGDPDGRVADVLLDQNIGAENDRWPVAAGCRRLAGLRYALMRDEILGRRPDRPRTETDQAADRVPGVLAFFGGTDAGGAAPVLANALVMTAAPFALRVVAATAGLRRVLEDIAGGPGQSIEVIDPTPVLAAEVVAADLVVSAAGTSSWELLCLGAAAGFVAVSGNQRTSYERVVAAGAVAGLGQLAELRDPAGEAWRTAVPRLDRLLTDPAERSRLRVAGFALVDGHGRVRVADALAVEN